MATSNPENLPTPPQQQQQPKPPSALQQQQQQQHHPDARLRNFMYNSSLAILVACPIIALLPPRKMDFYTFGLGVAFCMSAEYAMEHRTGRGLLWHVSARLSRERVRTQQQQREEKVLEEAEAETRRAAEREGVRRAVRAEEGERRARAEMDQEKEGRGYAGSILERVRGAFWDKGGEGKGGDGGESEKGG